MRDYLRDFLDEPVTSIESSQCENSRLLAAASSVQGWRARMEDFNCHHLPLPQDPNAYFFGVFDGHEGSHIAKYAADHLHEFVTKRPEYRNGSIQRAFELGFLDCDATMKTHFVSQLPKDRAKRVQELEVELRGLDEKKMSSQEKMFERWAVKSEQDYNKIDDRSDSSQRKLKIILNRIGGSAANIVFIKDDNVYCANLGDSRAVASVEGRLLELSKDHSIQNADKKEIARMKADGGWVCWAENAANGLTMTRAFGNYSRKDRHDKPPEMQKIIALPEVRMHKLTPGWEFVLLATDGLWGFMKSQEAVSFVRERIGRSERPRAITEALVRHCLGDPPPVDKYDAAVNDNVTALLVCFLPYEQLIRRCRTAAKPEHGQTGKPKLTPS